MSPLFLVEYVVYDEADKSASAASITLRLKPDKNSCDVSATRAIGSYYWVSEAC